LGQAEKLSAVGAQPGRGDEQILAPCRHGRPPPFVSSICDKKCDAPHDPSVAEESTDGDVPADNVNDGFVWRRKTRKAQQRSRFSTSAIKWCDCPAEVISSVGRRSAVQSF
jgi:hypothetical protein